MCTHALGGRRPFFLKTQISTAVATPTAATTPIVIPAIAPGPKRAPFVSPHSDAENSTPKCVESVKPTSPCTRLHPLLLCALMTTFELPLLEMHGDSRNVTLDPAVGATSTVMLSVPSSSTQPVTYTVSRAQSAQRAVR